MWKMSQDGSKPIFRILTRLRWKMLKTKNSLIQIFVLITSHNSHVHKILVIKNAEIPVFYQKKTLLFNRWIITYFYTNNFFFQWNFLRIIYIWVYINQFEFHEDASKEMRENRLPKKEVRWILIEETHWDDFAIATWFNVYVSFYVRLL